MFKVNCSPVNIVRAMKELITLFTVNCMSWKVRQRYLKAPMILWYSAWSERGYHDSGSVKVIGVDTSLDVNSEKDHECVLGLGEE